MYTELTDEELVKRIRELKEAKNAIILAHYYQNEDIQDLADYLGDSFGLSRKAACTDADIIVFCGVRFMAESAAILSPDKKVLIPEITAGCSLAETVNVEGLRRMKRKYPDYTVVTYVNSTAAVKAESDVCCTSSNALKIVEAVDSDRILFVPDRNIGLFVASQTQKKVIVWDGYCKTHLLPEIEDVKKIKRLYPEAPLLVHPECRPEIIALADFTGSTAEILKYVRKSSLNGFIIGTEEGIMYQLKKENTDKNFYPLIPQMICHDMKKITLEKVLFSLENNEYRIKIEEEVRGKAYEALKRMMELAR